jgi:phage terminase large subunit
MENNPEYVENLENLPDARKKAMLYGDWDAFEGQYFEEFDRDVHVVEPFEIPSYWNKYVSIDYGLDMLAAYWFAVDTKGATYVYREFCQPNLIISDAANRIKSLTKESITTYYAPPDLWNRRQDTGKSAAEVFGDNGVFLVKANNDRIQGWYNIKEWLQIYKVKDEQTGEERKTSRLKIWKNCAILIKNLPLLQHDDKRPNDVANEPHEITHSPDALRYFCSMRTAPASKGEDVVKKAVFKSEISKEATSNELKIHNSYVNYGF